MSSGILLSRSALGSPRALINSKLGTYPPDPLPLIREGGIMVAEGADAPSGFLSYQIPKGRSRGASPLLDTPDF